MSHTYTPVEVVPGIYKFRLPLVDNPAGFINTYLINGNSERVMMDTGWNDPAAFEVLIEQLKHLELNLEDINRIIYTHIHPDHFGLAGTIYHQYQIPLTIHREGKTLIEYRYYGRESYIRELGEWHLLNGGNQDNCDAVIEMSTDYTDHVEPVTPETLLSGGEMIFIDPFQLKVIWTPGHDNDHMCFYEENRGILFSGDHILPDTNPHIGTHSEIPFYPHQTYMKSLEVLKPLKVNIILPGHEGVFTDLHARIDDLISYHCQLKNDVHETTHDESMTAYQISSQISWFDGPMHWESLAPVVQAGLVTKCLSYLKALEAEGRIRQRVDKNGLRIYNAI